MDDQCHQRVLFAYCGGGIAHPTMLIHGLVMLAMASLACQLQLGDVRFESKTFLMLLNKVLMV